MLQKQKLLVQKGRRPKIPGGFAAIPFPVSFQLFPSLISPFLSLPLPSLPPSPLPPFLSSSLSILEENRCCY